MNFFHIQLIITFCILLVFDNCAIGQTILTDVYDTEGLSQNKVRTIIQDSKGFMWFGTHDGLNRYDGYEYTVYQDDPLDTNALIANYITFLMEDSKQNIWVGTDHGLCYYDQHKDRFVRLRFGNRNATKSQDEIGAIFEDSKGNIWVGTNLMEMILYRPKENVAPEFYDSEILPLPSDEGYRGVRTPCRIVEDRNNTIWISAPGRICTAQYNGNDIKFENYRNQKEGYPAMGNNFVFKDRDDVLWISQPSGHFVSELNDSITPFITNYAFRKKPLHDLSYRSVYVASDGKFWLSGLPDAFCVIDPKTDESYSVYTRNPISDKTDQEGNPPFINTGVSSIYEDRSGNMWIGHNGSGISIYSPNHHIFDSGKGAKKLDVGSSRGMLKTTDGVLWHMHSGHGLKYYDANTNSSHQTHYQEKGKSSPQPKIHTTNIIEDVNNPNILWASQSGGFIKILRNKTEIIETTKILIQVHDPVGVQSNVNNLIDDGKGNLWLIGRYELWKVNKKTLTTKTFRFLGSEDAANAAVFLLFCPDIHQENDSVLWISSQIGLQRFNMNTGQFESFRPRLASGLPLHYEIRSICGSEDGKHLWLATSSRGLVRFDIKQHSFKIFDKKDGLVDNCLYAALPDQQGHLWLSSNTGLMRFDLNDYSVVSYTVNDGLQDNEFNIYSEHLGHDGELFFGGIKGINRFYPSTIGENKYEPPTVITELKINNKKVNFHPENSPLKSPIYNTKKVVLYQDDRVVTFTITGLDYTNSKKKSIRL